MRNSGFCNELFGQDMIQIQGLTKSFGTQMLFEDATFVVGERERIGVVGRNGSGKTTLFRVIKGELGQDSGEVVFPKNYTWAALEQHIKFKYPTVLEEVIEGPIGIKEDEYRAKELLFGLGFGEDDMTRDPKSYSGGYQVRINLARALYQKPNLLLLDEPTNYLDILSLRWLKGFLKNFDGEVLLITHDREFMDEVVTHIVGIKRGKIKKIKGDTAKFYEQIMMEEAIYEQTRENLERKKKEIMNFVERFKAKASKAKQAQSRLKYLNKMESMDELQAEAQMGFNFHYKDINSKTLLEVKDLAFKYDGMEKNLFENISFSLNKGECLAVIGKNGRGKSTLLSCIEGSLKSQNGSVRFHNDVQVGYFGQTNINRLSPELSIRDEVGSANPDLSNTEVRAICGAMMFEGDLSDKKIKVLSGGEKARVMLGKILAKPCNVLLLDEPTNHLDMESIEYLSDEIAKFPGIVIIVTHSELMLRKLATKLIIFQHGGAEFFYGDYEDFLCRVGWEDEQRRTKKRSKGLSEKEIKKLRNELTIERGRILAPLKEKIQKNENDIMAMEELLAKYDGLLNDKVSKGEDIVEITKIIGQLHSKIDQLFEELSMNQEEYDKILAQYDSRFSELS
ncbi:MAG: ABC-F family ATP-binding cassette domain-containing protein [Bacteriovoracaceae bacterium]